MTKNLVEGVNIKAVSFPRYVHTFEAWAERDLEDINERTGSEFNMAG